MDYKFLQEKYSKCCQLVIKQHLYEAFTVLEELVRESHNGDLSVQLEHYRETYSNILRYSFGEIEDPEKKVIYHQLLRSVIELADEVRESIIVSKFFLSYCSTKKETIEKSILQQGKVLSFLDTLQSVPDFVATDTAIDEEFSLNEQQHKVVRLFNHLWLSDKYKDTEKEIALLALRSENIPWWIQCIVVTAVTLSLQRYFDEAKLIILAEAYKNSKKQISQRALVGIIITLYQYNQRLYMYPKIKGLLEDLRKGSNIEKQTEAVVIQFIKARDTEKIAQKFQDEILPEMSRIKGRIYDKLDMKNMIQDPFSDDKNPDWENVFQDSPGLLNKLEEFSLLQIEGSDVFMSTFSMLKQFDFFIPLSNWFLPFYKENSNVHEVLKEKEGSFDVNGFIEGMEKSTVLCNSDKYSFCLNLKYIPLEARSSMMELFGLENKAMEEISKEDELLRKPAYERIIFTQYIQDLYRFNKLYTYKQEFYDIFSTRADFHNTIFFDWLVKDVAIVRNIGEFLFEKKHYQDAIEVFLKNNAVKENSELWQKIAYCFQQLGNYQKALEYYLRADLINTKNAWNIKKVALCYRRVGNFNKALEYYLEAETLEPENLHIQANIAHTYLDLKDFENALKYYFKVEFLAPDNIKIQRPIAWCSFMLEKLDTAKKYFEKVLDAEGNRHDLLNLGHIEWCLGNKKKAIESYNQSIQKADADFNWFTQEFIADSEILIRYGIDQVNISLMLDYLKIQMEKK